MSSEQNGHVVEVNGIPIYYREAGEGSPLVFVHGWSMDSTYWRAQMEYFSKRYRVIAYDFRGAGRSGGAQPRFDLTQMVEDHRALMAALGIERPILCGHSQGGDIVLQFAVTYPDEIAALVPADAPWWLFKSKLMFLFTVLGIRVGQLLLMKPPHRALIPGNQIAFFGCRFRKKHRDRIKAWRQQFLSNSLPGLINTGRALGSRKSVADKLDRIKVPTLILRGTKDPVMQKAEANSVRRKIRGAKLDQLAGAGHTTPVEVPAAFNRCLDAFLKEHDL